MIHKEYINSGDFDSIINGNRTFDIRVNDNYKIGDTILYVDIDDSLNETGRWMMVRVIYVYDDSGHVPSALRKGLCILGIMIFRFENNIVAWRCKDAKN